MAQIPSLDSWMKKDLEDRDSRSSTSSEATLTGGVIPSVTSWTANDAQAVPQRPTAEGSQAVRKVKELNRRFKAIWEDEGMDYGEDTEDEDTIVNRFAEATAIRRNRIQDVFRAVRRDRNVEMCFLLDATNSMRRHIHGVRQSIYEIVRKLTAPESSAAKEVKLSVVAYRDYGCQRQLDLLPFTNSMSQFTTFMDTLRTEHGVDFPEDVLGGLDAALQLDWTANAGTKVIFHIGDAPCHGNEFHKNMKDNYPEGDPLGLNHTTLFALLRQKGILYHFGKMSDHTDIMLEKFSEAYGEPIPDFDLKEVENIPGAVVTAVSQSISTRIIVSQKTVGVVRKERNYNFDKVEPNWDGWPVCNGVRMSYALPENIAAIVEDTPLQRKPTKNAAVKIAPNPFAKGAERVAFYGLDVTTVMPAHPSKAKKSDIKHKDQPIVLKEYLHIGPGMNSARRYEQSNQMQTIATYLAQEFDKNLKQRIGLDKTIKFIKIWTLALDTGGPIPRFFSRERRFDGRFIRFTNNAGYAIMKENALALGVSQDLVELVMAFSHWTYKATDGFLMVVDLEGEVGKLGKDGSDGVFLTDPAIHCKDVTRYGPMNCGLKGMDHFFRNHTCNKYCEQLGLKDFRPPRPAPK